jgi:hypothetical protein
MNCESLMYNIQLEILKDALPEIPFFETLHGF